MSHIAQGRRQPPAVRGLQVTYEPGQTIIREGERGTKLYVIAEGEVSVAKAVGRPLTDLTVLTVRHQLLDLIGALALVGFPQAQVLVYRGSHGLHTDLAAAL